MILKVFPSDLRFKMIFALHRQRIKVKLLSLLCQQKPINAFISLLLAKFLLVAVVSITFNHSFNVVVGGNVIEVKKFDGANILAQQIDWL